MTHYPRCNFCNRIHISKNHECYQMRLALGNFQAPYQSWASKARIACMNCDKWGTIDGSTGCTLSPTKPCDIGYYQRKGQACFDDPPRYQSKYINFPEFPWDTPGGKLAVCTIVIGEAAEQLAEYTLPRIRKYADRINADLIVIDKCNYPQWPMANKFAIGSVVKNYDRTYYVDIDVWIRDKCPNVFETFEDHTVWVHQDANYLDRGHLEEDTHRLSRPGIELDCWNTGVVLQAREHWDIWTPPTKMQFTSHTCEQSSVELAIKDKNYKVGLWTPLWNNQYWTGQLFWNSFYDANVIHLSGIKNPTRIPILERLVKEEGLC